MQKAKQIKNERKKGKRKMEKRFNLEMAIEVAERDYNYGIIDGIDRLTDFGFDCSYFWDTIKKQDGDFWDIDSEVFIEARDNLFKQLGIEKIMERAYEQVFCCGW